MEAQESLSKSFSLLSVCLLESLGYCENDTCSVHEGRREGEREEGKEDNVEL